MPLLTSHRVTCLQYDHSHTIFSIKDWAIFNAAFMLTHRKRTEAYARFNTMSSTLVAVLVKLSSKISSHRWPDYIVIWQGLRWHGSSSHVLHRFLLLSRCSKLELINSYRTRRAFRRHNIGWCSNAFDRTLRHRDENTVWCGLMTQGRNRWRHCCVQDVVK